MYASKYLKDLADIYIIYKHCQKIQLYCKISLNIFFSTGVSQLWYISYIFDSLYFSTLEI